MDRDDNLKLVGEVYAAFGRGDAAAVLASMTEDVEWWVAGAPRVPYGGSRRGRSGVGEFLATLASTVDFEAFEVGEMRADGDTVVVVGRERLHGKKSGRVTDNDWVHVFTIRDGGVARFREFIDTGAVASIL